MGKKTNVQKGKKGFQRTNPKAVSPAGGKKGLFGRKKKEVLPNPEDMSPLDPGYSEAVNAYYGIKEEKTAEKKRPYAAYRVYDDKDRPIGFYATEQEANMRAMAVGGWVREYEKKEEEGLVKRVFGDGRSTKPSDSKDFDLPKKTAFERPAKKYKVVDSKGNSKGTFEDEWDARMKAQEVGGKVNTYVLKPEYKYANPKSQMSPLKRLLDNGEAYEKSKKK